MKALGPESNEWKVLVRDWNQRRGPHLQIRESDWLWNLAEQSLVSYSWALLAGVPAILAHASESGLKAGLSAKSLWLSLWGEVSDASRAEFLSSLESLSSSLGKSRVSFGGDEFHFVPGVPVENASDAALVQDLKRAGFQTAEVCDFVGRIDRGESADAVAEYITEALEIARRERIELRPALTNVDQSTLGDFLRTEFPGRWSREYEFWIARDDAERASWSALIKNSAIVGFARTAIRSRHRPDGSGWTPGALRLPLGDERESAWLEHDSCLGPIGVALSQRGQGTGRVLLGLVLDSLKRGHANRTCIDWTDALKYYRPLKFTIVRQYCSAWRVSSSK